MSEKEEVQSEERSEDKKEIKVSLNGKPDRLFEWKEDCRRAVV